MAQFHGGCLCSKLRIKAEDEPGEAPQLQVTYNARHVIPLDNVLVLSGRRLLIPLASPLARYYDHPHDDAAVYRPNILIPPAGMVNDMGCI